MFKNSNKIVRGVVLASLLASTSLAALSSVKVEAQVSPDKTMSKIVNQDPTTIASGIEYVDVNGYTQTLEIPSDVAVQLNANPNRIIVKIGKETKYLENVKDVTIKNITVSNAVAFHYLTSAEKVTFDNVNFQRGVDFGGLKNIKELVVKDSSFGEYCGYSLAVHDAPKLETFVVSNAKMSSDFRIYCNKSLEKAYVYDSEIVGHAKQHTNKKGYTTDYQNTTFRRSGNLKKIYTEGSSLNAAFNINLAGEAMGNSKFNASTEGKITYVNANGDEQVIPVPGNTYIKYIDDTQDRIRVKLSNNQQFYIDNPRELTFRNVEFRAPMEFTHRNLRLEKIEIINSKIWNVQVWNSETLQSLKINSTEIGHPCTLVKAYNNKVQDTFSIQDSKLVDVKAMNLPNVKDSVDGQTGFSMYNTYTHGYVYTANIGNSDYELPIYNNRFDNYIASTNTINGVASRKTVGYAPTLEVQDFIFNKRDELTDEIIFSNVNAQDKEDGDINANLKVVSNSYVQGVTGAYKVVVSVTDSDGNEVVNELTVRAQ